MNHLKVILWVLFWFVFKPIFAHQDIYAIENYGNVKVKISSYSFDLEEVNRSFIIAQLVQKLSIQLNNKDSIYLDFDHSYMSECKSAYFLSYGINNQNLNVDDDKNISFEKAIRSNTIILKSISYSFDEKSILKLIEFAILNKNYINTTQRVCAYKSEYYNYNIVSLDTNETKTVLFNESSLLQKEILSKIIERPNQNFKSGISYKFENGNFYLFNRNSLGKDSSFMYLKNIYLMKEVVKIKNTQIVAVFESDTVFYFVNRNVKTNQLFVSKKYILKHCEYKEPIHVSKFKRNTLKVSTNFFHNFCTKVDYIYFYEKDELVLVDNK
ncbi:MAG: hypothetical protein RLZZ175_719 [Bacteroidota bacterium]|jgi:hypothetical protein